ncbi:CCA tRNA nucleotidyltransferase [Pseudooceanicola sp. 200-1SW]|uniref:CCA tRNA nucleotidyltransferase n=1 Tax=Pseudooceanicola sp. 200-1SW TaxID=3425949 RepID=UPI003D7F8E14
MTEDAPRITGAWLTAPATRAVCDALTGAGHQAWFVGGCVRDALLSVPVGDIDISTDARPETTLALAKAAGLKALPTGLDHGTITVISGGIPHEVTTWRRDVETDGRHAVVAFADTMAEDAHRRDFTMNALYADPEGRVADPLGQGLADLAARHLRFIDDPDQRIREDYLRILRYFRFHARFGDPEAGMDPEALAAIAANADGIDSLSRERIGAELLKLLSVPDPMRALAAMEQTGVLRHVLPGAGLRALGPLVHLAGQGGLAPDPVLRLAALGGEDPGAALRLPKKDAARIARLRDEAAGPRAPAELGWRHGAAEAQAMLILRAALLEMPLPPEAMARAAFGAAQTFPLTARDLQPRFQGAELGAALRRAEAAWIASDFTLGAGALLAAL